MQSRPESGVDHGAASRIIDEVRGAKLGQRLLDGGLHELSAREQRVISTITILRQVSKVDAQPKRRELRSLPVHPPEPYAINGGGTLSPR